jgi:hypothetical protein
MSAELRHHAATAIAAARRVETLLAQAAAAHRDMTDALTRTRAAARAASIPESQVREAIDRLGHGEQLVSALARGGVSIPVAAAFQSSPGLGDLVGGALKRLIAAAGERDAA